MSSNSDILVAALSAGVHTPSSRFRLRQYIPYLEKEGVTVKEHIPFFEKSCGFPSPFKAAARIPALIRSRSADLVWMGKELVQGYATFERLLKRPRMMDVDDAIWLSWPLGWWAAGHIARAMDALVVGNKYLADYFDRHNKHIHIIPTGIDLSRYQLRPLPEVEPESFVIGWTGLACNYKYLKTLEPGLIRFLQDHPRAEIQLLSNKPWKKTVLPPDRVTYIPWSPDNEATALHSFSVGIMPLSDDKWTRGKCSFKMLQYMAVGLPVVVSPVGMNREVLEKDTVGMAATSEDQWVEALETLYRDWNLRKQLGRAGRNVVEQHYDTKSIAQKLARIFQSMAR